MAVHMWVLGGAWGGDLSSEGVGCGCLHLFIFHVIPADGGEDEETRSF